MANIKIYVNSLSGNTLETAEIIKETLLNKGHVVSLDNIALTDTVADLDSVDFLLLGSFTDDYGSTPEDMDFLVDSISFPSDKIATFGTGETQWGIENFCKAADNIAERLRVINPPLKVEQLPISEKVIDTIINWTLELSI